MRVLVVDNYDSFTYNLVQYLAELGAEPLVYRNDEISLEQARQLQPDRIVLSPGPGTPTNERDFGVCTGLLREMATDIPTLGVCLGHQGVAAAFGGRVAHAERLLHGKTSVIHHDGQGVFHALPQGFLAARYHSLIVELDDVPDELVVSARSAEGEIMGLRHMALPIEGVQFHPESILTEHGHRLLANFLHQDKSVESDGSVPSTWTVNAP